MSVHLRVYVCVYDEVTVIEIWNTKQHAHPHIHIFIQKPTWDMGLSTHMKMLARKG